MSPDLKERLEEHNFKLRLKIKTVELLNQGQFADSAIQAWLAEQSNIPMPIDILRAFALLLVIERFVHKAHPNEQALDAYVDFIWPNDLRRVSFSFSFSF